MAGRDEAEFPQWVVTVLGNRVGWRCSKPDCRAPTRGAHTDADKSISVGVAAHIHGAAPTSARYDATQTNDERRLPENGVHLCQTHSRLVDTDAAAFPVGLLREWKE